MDSILLYFHLLRSLMDFPCILMYSISVITFEFCFAPFAIDSTVFLFPSIFIKILSHPMVSIKFVTATYNRYAGHLCSPCTNVIVLVKLWLSILFQNRDLRLSYLKKSEVIKNLFCYIDFRLIIYNDENIEQYCCFVGTYFISSGCLYTSS